MQLTDPSEDQHRPSPGKRSQSGQLGKRATDYPSHLPTLVEAPGGIPYAMLTRAYLEVAIRVEIAEKRKKKVNGCGTSESSVPSTGIAFSSKVCFCTDRRYGSETVLSIVGMTMEARE